MPTKKFNVDFKFHKSPNSVFFHKIPTIINQAPRSLKNCLLETKINWIGYSLSANSAFWRLLAVINILLILIYQTITKLYNQPCVNEKFAILFSLANTNSTRWNDSFHDVGVFKPQHQINHSFFEQNVFFAIVKNVHSFWK